MQRHENLWIRAWKDRELEHCKEVDAFQKILSGLQTSNSEYCKRINEFEKTKLLIKSNQASERHYHDQIRENSQSMMNKVVEMVNEHTELSKRHADERMQTNQEYKEWINKNDEMQRKHFLECKQT